VAADGEWRVEDFLARFWSDLAGRADGPFHLRFVLQPSMSLLFGIRDGREDSRAGRPAYLWKVLVSPEERAYLLRDGWKSLAKVFSAALAIDVVYQLVVLRWIYPGQTLVTASILALVPYALIRGVANRIARRRSGES
jgi:hypothetical protein